MLSEQDTPRATRVISRRTLLRAALTGAGAATFASVLAACSATVPGAPAPASSGQSATSAPATGSGAGALKIGLLSGFSGPYAAFGPDMA
ncbi:MAG TPA: hypothetical protein VF937_02860, partial [Chloroflexota bacterium]